MAYLKISLPAGVAKESVTVDFFDDEPVEVKEVPAEAAVEVAPEVAPEAPAEAAVEAVV